jgi:hemoglobin-like flavoprotein
MTDLMKSYFRIRESGLADRFYEIFLDADPRIRPLFKNTDFKRQKELLIEALFVILQYAEGKSVGELAIERLGDTHSRKRMNIPPDLYPIWLKCMIQSLSEKDPEFSPVLELEWRSAIQKAVAIMVRMY